MAERSYKFDNCKAILIFLVVLCHFFELFGGSLKYRLYTVIYTFHMPLFVFVSGYFAKFKLKALFTKQLYPYILFQFLFLILFGGKMQFLTPYWLMWYMFAMVLWYLTLPLLNKAPALMLGLSIAIALVAGFFDKIGYFLSLSRILCFYPYFALGFWCRQKGITEKQVLYKLSAKITALFLAALSVFIVLLLLNQIKTNWLYNAVSYNIGGYNAEWRLLFMILATLWIFAFLVLMPDKKIPIFSESGKYSVCTYLLHGFVQRFFLNVCNIFVFSDLQNLFLSLLLSFGIVVLFSNRYAYSVLKYAFDLQSFFPAKKKAQQ